MTAWADELREAAPDILDVAAHLGLSVTRRRFGHCPACGRGDRHHPPVTPRHAGRGWLCARCKAGGDAIRLACWVVLGKDRANSGDEWGQVRARLAAGGWCSADGDQRAAWTPPPPRPPPPEPPYPDGQELRYLLGACSPVSSCLPVARWCRSRGLDPQRVPAAVLPDRYDWPAWWPYGARPWRLVVSMVDAAGQVTSMHARATEDTGGRRKTTWPRDRRATGLLFADLPARQLLRGAKCPELRRIVVGEGITDYLAAASRRHPGTAVLGACSGGFGALAALGAHRLPVYVATDSDTAGERYAAEVERALPGADLRRVVLPPGVDVADYLADGRPLDPLLALARRNATG